MAEMSFDHLTWSGSVPVELSWYEAMTKKAIRQEPIDFRYQADGPDDQKVGRTRHGDFEILHNATDRPRWFAVEVTSMDSSGWKETVRQDVMVPAHSTSYVFAPQSAMLGQPIDVTSFAASGRKETIWDGYAHPEPVDWGDSLSIGAQVEDEEIVL